MLARTSCLSLAHEESGRGGEGSRREAYPAGVVPARERHSLSVGQEPAHEESARPPCATTSQHAPARSDLGAAAQAPLSRSPIGRDFPQLQAVANLLSRPGRHGDGAKPRGQMPRLRPSAPPVESPGGVASSRKFGWFARAKARPGCRAIPALGPVKHATSQRRRSSSAVSP